jgi:L-ascorbate metabolism protein UlaG (beta-lactamase superfamily)
VHTSQTRLLLAALVLTAGLVSVRAADGEPKAAGAPAGAKMGCKCLKGVVHLRDNDLRFARKGGGVVFVDPTAGPTDPLAVKAGLLKPDLILITHPHGDHFQPAVLQEYIKANPQVVLAGPAEVVKLAQEKGIAGMQVVAPNQTYTLAGFEFSTVPAYFEKKDWNHPQSGGWVGYVLALNGARYYVTGDTQPLPEMAAVKADVIFPLLSGCGGNTAQALEMARISGAHLVVPVHHSNQVETIKKYIAQLPAGVQSAYYLDGKLTPTL